MSLFGISSANLQAKVQPSADEQTFLIGADGDLSVAGAEEIIDAMEDRLLMRVPHRYRQMLTAIDGEIVVDRARGGETVVQAGLFPIVSGSMKVWRNFPSSGLWMMRDERLAMSTDDYSVNLETGAVTLSSPLVSGDWLWLEYRHTGAARVLGLRDMALTLAAVEVARRFAFFRDGEGWDRFEDWERNVYSDLNAMKCIDVLDRIRLVREDTEPDNFYQRVLMGFRD